MLRMILNGLEDGTAEENSNAKPQLTCRLYNEDKDWDEFLPFFAEGFIDSIFAKRYLPDAKKRKRFLLPYFRYMNEIHFKCGRAVLLGMKTNESGDVNEYNRIMWGGILLFDTSIPGNAKKTNEMASVYPEGAENVARREVWLEKKIHAPMRQLATELGTEAWFAAIHATAPEYREHELSTRFVSKMQSLAWQHGMERRRQLCSPPAKIPPFIYTFFVNATPGTMRYVETAGQTVVAHLHFNHKEGLKCHRDPTADDDGDISCHLISVPKSISPIAKKFFQSYKP